MLEQLLARILNPNPGNRLANPIDGQMAQTGLGPDQLARYHQMSGMGGGVMPAPQAAPPAPAMAPQAPMPDQMQTASVAAPASSGGGFLSRLFGGRNSEIENQTADWLTKQGYDPGTARALAGNKEVMQRILLSQVGGNKPIEISGRLVDPNTYEVLADFSGGGPFEGTSVEAQSLNHLVRTGQLTQDQAAQLGAGKTITNPADGSITFLTPQGVFGQPANGGPPQPLTPQPGAGGVDASAPSATGRPGIIPLTEGKPGKLATEGERRNRSLYSVVAPELKIVEDNFDALADLRNQAYSRLPLSEYVTTPEYQQAANSLQTIVSSYLYSVSGATATPDEVRKQTDILTPRPGESKVSIDSKKRRVRAMVDSIRQSGGQWEPGGEQPSGKTATPEQLQAMPPPEGIEPNVWKFMKPEDRKLWLE